MPNFLRLTAPFISREAELANITEMLGNSACQLVTLVGPGGVGKTSLATQVALKMEPSFADGAYFVALQPLISAEFLPSAILESLKLPSSHAEESPQNQLLHYLREKQFLLVLDNFEHLLDGATILAEILEVAPAVKLLVTSREVLNLRAEWIFPVTGLRFPAPEDVVAPQEFGAVQLFVECARRVHNNFSLKDEQTEVVRICQLVEGVPLALELAASWLKLLPCTAIATEIERNLDFLKTTLRDVPERHRSMRAVFDESWKLLTLEEKEVLKRLSVFQGSFSREAAEVVAGASLPLLSALIDKSLLQLRPPGRYQLHELLRHYTRERLQQHPQEALATVAAHRSYYATFLAQHNTNIRGENQLAAIVEIQEELDNIRRAWDNLVQAARVGVVEIRQAAYTLSEFYHYRSYYREGAASFEKAVQVFEAEKIEPPQVLTLTELLVYLAWFYIRLGKLVEARALAERSLHLLQQLGVAPVPGHGTDPQVVLGILLLIQGDYAGATRLGQKALRENESRGDLLNLSISYYILADAKMAQGQYQEALSYAEQAYQVAKAQNHLWFMAYCLNQQGKIGCAIGEYPAAQRHFQESYTLRDKFEDPEGRAVALSYLGKVAALQADYLGATELYRRSIEIYRAIGDKGGLTSALIGLGNAFCNLKNYPAATHYLMEALNISQTAQLVTLTLSVIAQIGELLQRTGRTELAIQTFAFALQHSAINQETTEHLQKLLNSSTQVLPGALFTSLIEQGRAFTVEELVLYLHSELVACADEVEVTRNSPKAVPTHPKTSIPEQLSERELEVLNYLAEGLSNEEIAERLIITVGTVKAHNHHIFSKLWVKNRSQAVYRARELELLPLPR